MNIFYDKIAFWGNLDKEVTEDSLPSIFRLAKQIRLRLGKQGYLLDNYLNLIFQGLDEGFTSEIMNEGEEISCSLQQLLRHVLNGTEPAKPHPLYQRMREVLEQHKEILSFQEQYTRGCLLMALLADEWMAHTVAEFVEEQNKFLFETGDIVYLRQLYDEICRLAGESLMEDLNRRLQRRFLIVSKVPAFAQGFTDDLIGRLSWRDRETSKQIFQLLLDIIPGDSEGA